MNKIEENLRNFIGDLGLAKAGFRFIKTSENKGILQTDNKSLDTIRAGLALIKEIDKTHVRIRTLKVSGILNKLSGDI